MTERYERANSAATTTATKEETTQKIYIETIEYHIKMCRVEKMEPTMAKLVDPGHLYDNTTDYSCESQRICNRIIYLWHYFVWGALCVHDFLNIFIAHLQYPNDNPFICLFVSNRPIPISRCVHTFYHNHFSNMFRIKMTATKNRSQPKRQRQ